MDQAAPPIVLLCDGCGKQYRVKAAPPAGKALRCKCGQILHPAEAAAPAPPPPDEPLVAAPAPAPARRQFTTAVKSTRRVTDALDAREDEQQPSRLLDLYLPVAILVLGAAGGAALGPCLAKPAAGRGAYLLTSVALQALVFLPVAFAGAIITARLLATAFGSLSTLLLKLAAVTLGTGAIADALFFYAALMNHDDVWTPVIGFVPYMILCGAPLALLCSLSMMETALMVGFIYAIRFATFIGIGMMFPKLFE